MKYHTKFVWLVEPGGMERTAGDEGGGGEGEAGVVKWIYEVKNVNWIKMVDASVVWYIKLKEIKKKYARCAFKCGKEARYWMLGIDRAGIGWFTQIERTGILEDSSHFFYYF